MKKILFVQKSLVNPGGAAVAQRVLIRASMDKGYTTFGVSLDGKIYSLLGNNQRTKDLIKGKQSRYSRLGFDKKIYQFLISCIKEFDPDVIIVGNIHSYFSVLLALKKIKAKKIHVIHGAENFCLNSMLTKMKDLAVCPGQFGTKCIKSKCEPIYRFPFKYFLHKLKNLLLKATYDAFIVHSQYMKEKEIKVFGDKVFYVPLSVDFSINDVLSNSREIIKNKLVFVGTLSWNKGIWELLEAIASIKDGVDFHLDVIGNGEEYDNIIEFLKRNNIQSKVSLLGNLKRKETISKMQEAAAVIVPSYFESFGLVALEAMFLKKALVVSNRGALPEITKNYSSAFILKEISKEEIARQLKNAILHSNDDPPSKTFRFHPDKVKDFLEKVVQEA
jgi:glycosyltransferase involved in cell wall biosynthesis